MPSRGTYALTLASLVLVAFGAAPARADLAADFQADLVASGVSGAVVTVATPTAASAPLDEDASAAMTFGALRPFLSPNPFSPLPIVKVVIAFPEGDPLAGILPTPGLGGSSFYTTNVTEVAEANLAVIEALKHAMATGAQLSGVELDIDDAGPPGLSQSLIAAPNIADLPPRQVVDSVMPISELKLKIEQDLPVWAKGARIEITEDFVGERVVRASLALPVSSFVSTVVEELTAALDRVQGELAIDGANIGRTIVEITDPVTDDPLYMSADDKLWTYHSSWYSPLVAGFSGRGPAVSPEGIQQAVEGAGPAAVQKAEGAKQEAEQTVERKRQEAQPVIDEKQQEAQQAAAETQQEVQGVATQKQQEAGQTTEQKRQEAEQTAANLDQTVQEKRAQAEEKVGREVKKRLGDDLYACSFEASGTLGYGMAPANLFWPFNNARESDSFSVDGRASCYQRDNNAGEPSDWGGSDNSGSFATHISIYGTWESLPVADLGTFDCLAGVNLAGYLSLDPPTEAGSPPGAGAEGGARANLTGKIVYGVGSLELRGPGGSQSPGEVKLGTGIVEAEGKHFIWATGQTYSPLACYAGNVYEVQLRGTFELAQYQS